MNLVRVDRRTSSEPDDPLRDGGPWWPLADRLCAPLGCADWRVTAVLVDDEEMAELNGRYRSRPEPTDVLSFSYLEPRGDGDCALAARRNWAFRDLWYAGGVQEDHRRDLTVGEIVVAPDFVRDRCLRSGWDMRSEIGFCRLSPPPAR